MLTNADVLTFIIKIQQELALEAKVDVAMIIQQLTRIGFSNGIGDVVCTRNGEFEIRDDANFEGINFVSQKIRSDKKRRSKSFVIKAEDRLKALELLSKILGFHDQYENRAPRKNLKITAHRLLEALGQIKQESYKSNDEHIC